MHMTCLLDYLQSFGVYCVCYALEMMWDHVAHLFPLPIRLALSQTQQLDFGQTCHSLRPRPVGLLGLINPEEIPIHKHMHAGSSLWERTRCILFLISASGSSTRQREHSVCDARRNSMQILTLLLAL